MVQHPYKPYENVRGSDDVYYHTIKTKYLTGLVSTVTTSCTTLGTAGGMYVADRFGGRVYCDKTLKIGLSNGSFYYAPLFAWGEA